MKHYLLTLLLMMAALTAMGQQTVSVADAKAKAAAFLNRSAGAKGGTVTTDVQLAYTAQQGNETYYYVFNNGSNGQGGFVIIGGDETARTILGYSDNGAFDPNNMPENMKWWLSQYEQQISAAIKNGGTTAAAKGGMGGVKSIARADKAPLCATTWDQNAPYNTAIPKILNNQYDSNGAFATGCVATAMAQIMKKYNYPTHGTGSYGYDIDYGSAGIITFQADFANTTYDWANMKNSYAYNVISGGEQGPYEQAVATLMYHCGVAADMLYGQIGGTGSSASSHTAAQGMINYFGYDKGMSYEERAFYTDDDWEEMIYAELAAGRPVLYSGRTSLNQGHAFVCDGYQAAGNLFHINWGWSGNYNDYFALQGTSGEVLKPAGTGTGGGAEGYAYDQSQSAVIGIQPYNGGSNVCKVTNPDGYNLSGAATIVLGGTLSVRGQFKNSSLETKNFTIGVRFENTETNENIYLKATSRTLEPASMPVIINTEDPGFEMTVTDLEAGQTYRVYPVFYDNTEDVPTWKDIPTTQQPIPTITITEGNTLYLMDTPSFGNNGEYTIMNGTDEESMNLTLKFKNNTGADINNKVIVVYIFPDQEGSSSSKGLWVHYLTIANGETKTINLNKSNTQSLSITANSRYHIRVQDYSTKAILYNDKQTYFIPTNKQSISYKLSSVGWGTLCLPFSAEIPSGLTLYEVTSTAGNELTKTEVDKIEMNKAYLVSGTAGTYNFTGPTTPTGTYTNGLLTGNTNSTTVFVPKDSYVLQNLSKGLAFYKVANNDSQKCSPYKAYLTLTSGETSLYSALLFTDGTTGIESIEATDNQQGAVRKVLKNGRLTIETPQGSFTPAGARMK